MEIIKSDIVSLHGVANSMQGGRPENQDDMAFVDTELGLLVLICDGMGGGPGGKTASYIVKYEMVTALCECTPQTPRDHALKMAAARANDALEKKMLEVPALQGMGSTFVAALISKDSAYVAHAGDSRCYLLRRGKCIYRSKDHSLVGELVRKRALTEEEARVSPQSNIITRGLGSTSNHVPEIDEVPYRKGDRFVLCTDGVWGSMPQADLLRRLAEKADLQHIVTNLSAEIDEMGFSKGGCHDNHTIAVVDMDVTSTLKPKRPWRRIALISASALVLAALMAILIAFLARKSDDQPAVASFSTLSGYPGRSSGDDLAATSVQHDAPDAFYDSLTIDSLRRAALSAARQNMDSVSAQNDNKADTPSKDKADTPSKDKADTPSKDKADTPSKDKADTPSKDKADTPSKGKADTPSKGKADTPSKGKANDSMAESETSIKNLITSYEAALKVSDSDIDVVMKKLKETMSKIRTDADELEKQSRQSNDAQYRNEVATIRKNAHSYRWDKRVAMGKNRKYCLNGDAEYEFNNQINRLKALQDMISRKRK